MIEIYVDADACPVKYEIVRVADRHNLRVNMVSNGGIRPNQHPLVTTVIVDSGPDAADNWIADRIRNGDIAITNDIPLAALCIENGANVIRPNGDVLNKQTIGGILATRNLMTNLRAAGEVFGGPKPFGSKDRSKFLDYLERTVQAAKRC
ncbi:MAG: hypothetical protein CMI96_04820 [Pelagibacteraceae bacterium]|nr:hypothetical protein [Pelagibacteraceae bacterium]PPR09984.1 MAG: hypothetical protein CFH41_02038 [Alphaproteobacteria bacterium MarineAlpha11_Bin1]|tara:strand:+ start:17967 stop:18416 length:450 start_codon:yes stop_codon:yes gene_type:complete